MSRWGPYRGERATAHKPLRPLAGIVEATIYEHAKQLTMRLGEGQPTEVLHPGPLPKGIHF